MAGSPCLTICSNSDLLDDAGDPADLADFRGHGVERQRFRDGGPGLAEPLGEILVGVAAALREAVEGFGLFERGQVLALDVLDERQFQHLGFIHIADDHRELGEPRLNGGVIAPLAGHDLIPGPPLADDQRLDNPLLANRRNQLRQIAHGLARLVGIRVDQFDRYHPSDRLASRRGQGLDVVRVVAHSQGFGQASFRHGR